MSDILLNQDLLNSIIDVISYQNKLLIKQISQDKGWDLKKLKQKLRQHVPDDEDEVTGVQKLFWNIQDNLETANLVTFI